MNGAVSMSIVFYIFIYMYLYIEVQYIYYIYFFVFTSRKVFMGHLFGLQNKHNIQLNHLEP